jgi:hypothetical protein
MDEAAPRDRATLRREIAEVERYLRDVPPHTGSGYREDLRDRLERLRRELAGHDRRDDDAG